MNRYLLIASLTLGAATVATTGLAQNDTALEPGAGAKPAMVRPPALEKFSARLLDVKDGRLRFTVPARKEERVVHLEPALAKALGPLAGRSFQVSAVARPAPSGLAGAMVLRDTRGLYAITESIRDNRRMLEGADRGDIEVAQLAGEQRTFVYETECAVVYNVPAAFSIGKERHVLQANESKEVAIGKARYVLSLTASRQVVAKPCPAVFEGAQQEIDYALVRK